jgi:hypothetical protein
MSQKWLREEEREKKHREKHKNKHNKEAEKKQETTLLQDEREKLEMQIIDLIVGV